MIIDSIVMILLALLTDLCTFLNMIYWPKISLLGLTLTIVLWWVYLTFVRAVIKKILVKGNI
jgi:hypothetical protein